MKPEIDVIRSLGKGKNGKHHAFVRPYKYCFNRSRRVSGFTLKELAENIAKVVEKYYTPMNYYIVDGQLIGSNNERNALTEYYRVCSPEKQDQIFPVVLKELPNE